MMDSIFVQEVGTCHPSYHYQSFKLAFHKLKASVWDLDEVSEGQKADSLLRAADNFQFASSL